MSVCFAEDDYVRLLQLEHRTAVWVAELAGGGRVWMDDFRPGPWHHSAWVRLREHLRREGGAVTGLTLRFRDNVYRVPAPEGTTTWFFCKSAVRTDGLAETLGFYLVGWLQGGGLRLQRVLVPELAFTDEQWRDPNQANVTECLIHDSRRETAPHHSAAGSEAQPGYR